MLNVPQSPTGQSDNQRDTEILVQSMNPWKHRRQNENAAIHPAIAIEINEEEKKAYVTIKKTDSFPSYC